MISYTHNSVKVYNLTWETITTFSQFIELVKRATKMRQTDKTSQNERSSRSHCIYKLKIIRSDGKVGLINVVDLAGSERSR